MVVAMISSVRRWRFSEGVLG